MLSCCVLFVVLLLSLVGPPWQYDHLAGGEGADCFAYGVCVLFVILSNLNSSNTDGSFTINNSNSFLSPYEILPIAQEN